MFEYEQPTSADPRIKRFMIGLGKTTYVVLALLIDAGCTSAVLFDPGRPREERFGNFLFGTMMLMLSLVLSAPLFPYVVWKLVKHEWPVFWGIALLIAAFPMILAMAAIIIKSG